MREYKIIRSDLGFNIYRRREKNGLIEVQFLNGHGGRSLYRKYAKTFYNEEDVKDALVLIRIKCRNDQ